MELQRYELQKELVNTDVEGEIIIRALTDGKVDSLSVTVGQMVNTGDSLLQVIPENIENYYLILWVPNDAVPYISAGDKVKPFRQKNLGSSLLRLKLYPRLLRQHRKC